MTRELIVDGLKEVIANGRSASMHAISKPTDYTHTRIVGYAHSLEDATLFAASEKMLAALKAIRELIDVPGQALVADCKEASILARAAISKAEVAQ